MNNLEQQFHDEMIFTYKEAKKLGYRPNLFLKMLNKYGAINTAKKLLATEDFVQKGIIRLWELGGLSLSMEASVVKPKYRELFTEHEIRVANKRLKDLGYKK